MGSIFKRISNTRNIGLNANELPSEPVNCFNFERMTIPKEVKILNKSEYRVEFEIHAPIYRMFNRVSIVGILCIIIFIFLALKAADDIVGDIVCCFGFLFGLVWIYGGIQDVITKFHITMDICTEFISITKFECFFFRKTYAIPAKKLSIGVDSFSIRYLQNNDTQEYVSLDFLTKGSRKFLNSAITEMFPNAQVINE